MPIDLRTPAAKAWERETDTCHPWETDHGDRGHEAEEWPPQRFDLGQAQHAHPIGAPPPRAVAPRAEVESRLWAEGSGTSSLPQPEWPGQYDQSGTLARAFNPEDSPPQHSPPQCQDGPTVAKRVFDTAAWDQITAMGGPILEAEPSQLSPAPQPPSAPPPGPPRKSRRIGLKICKEDSAQQAEQWPEHRPEQGPQQGAPKTSGSARGSLWRGTARRTGRSASAAPEAAEAMAPEAVAAVAPETPSQPSCEVLDSAEEEELDVQPKEEDDVDDVEPGQDWKDLPRVPWPLAARKMKLEIQDFKEEMKATLNTALQSLQDTLSSELSTLTAAVQGVQTVQSSCEETHQDAVHTQATAFATAVNQMKIQSHNQHLAEMKLLKKLDGASRGLLDSFDVQPKAAPESDAPDASGPPVPVPIMLPVPKRLPNSKRASTAASSGSTASNSSGATATPTAVKAGPLQPPPKLQPRIAAKPKPVKKEELGESPSATQDPLVACAWLAGKK